MNETLYRILTGAIDPLAPLLVRARIRGEDAARERQERLGQLGETPAGHPIWLHAASAGEMEGAAPIIGEIRARLPGTPLVVTAMTRAGRARAETIADQVYFAPVDLPSAIRRSFDTLRPSALLLAETEIWPNWIAEAERRWCPVAIVNGRISPRSFRRMEWAGPLYRSALRRITHFGVQSEADGERFGHFGVPPSKIFVHGNTKIDTPAPEPGPLPIEVRPGDRWVVFGSVRTAERDAVIGAVKAALDQSDSVRVVVAPRHVDRVGTYLEVGGIDWSRWSGGVDRDARVILLDTMGDLLAFYAIASVAFVGGSLSGHGGHNPLEPARFGVPVLMGRNTESCAGTVAILEEAGALERVADGASLAEWIALLLVDENERRRRGEAGRAAVETNRGAAARCVERLIEERILGGAGGER